MKIILLTFNLYLFCFLWLQISEVEARSKKTLEELDRMERCMQAANKEKAAAVKEKAVLEKKCNQLGSKLNKLNTQLKEEKQVRSSAKRSSKLLSDSLTNM